MHLIESNCKESGVPGALQFVSHDRSIRGVRSGLMRIVVAVAGRLLAGSFVMGSLATFSSAQDHLLHKLPRQPAIYFWTNDAAELVSRVRHMAGDSAEAARERDDVDQANESTSRAMLRLRHFLDILDRLEQEAFFDEDAMLILPVNDPRVYMSMDAPQERLSISGPIFIARTSANKDELTEFFDSLQQLWQQGTESDEVGTSASSSIQTEKLKFAGTWDCQTGWFCWASTEDQTAEILTYLTGQVQTNETLAKDREFQVSMRQLQTQLDGSPTLSFYVTKEALPIVGELARGELPSRMMWGLDLGWRGLSLHELRGFAGRVYLTEPRFSDELDSPFALDAFLCMTQPRHGLLRGLGRDDRRRLDFNAPHRNRPILHFSQFVIDGEEFALGIQETRSSNNVGASSEDRMMEKLIRISETLHIADDNDDLWSADRQPNLLMQFEDAGNTIAQVMSVGDFHEERSVEEFAPKLDRNSLSDIRAWSYSDSFLQGIREQFENEIEELEQKLESSQEADPSMREPSRASMLSQLKNIRVNLESLERMATVPQLLLVKDWMMPFPLDYLDVVGHSVDEPHPQLLELKSVTKQMNKAFANRDDYCGIVAFWLPHVRSRLELARQHHVKPTVDGRGQGKEPWRPTPETISTSVFIAGRFVDKVVIAVNSTDDGFRFNGVVMRPPIVADQPDSK